MFFFSKKESLFSVIFIHILLGVRAKDIIDDYPTGLSTLDRRSKDLDNAMLSTMERKRQVAHVNVAPLRKRFVLI